MKTEADATEVKRGTPHAGFVEIDGKRFELDGATLVLYHCESTEADWNLELRRSVDGDEQILWLSGTVSPSPSRAEDLPGRELSIETRDIDELFEALAGTQVTTYPGGQGVCRATFTTSAAPEGMVLRSAFEFDWDRTIDPPNATYPEPRTARLELAITAPMLHPGGLPESLGDG